MYIGTEICYLQKASSSFVIWQYTFEFSQGKAYNRFKQKLQVGKHNTGIWRWIEMPTDLPLNNDASETRRRNNGLGSVLFSGHRARV